MSVNRITTAVISASLLGMAGIACASPHDDRFASYTERQLSAGTEPGMFRGSDDALRAGVDPRLGIRDRYLAPDSVRSPWTVHESGFIQE